MIAAQRDGPRQPAAYLWIRGTDDGKPLDYSLWFSDVYVCTPNGWRYAFGQAGTPVRNAP